MQRLVWQNSNGDEINLTSGNYGITNWEGFANTSLNIQSQQVPFQDGGVFLDALIEQRELSVTLKMQDNGNLEERYRMRRELIHALNPKLGEGYLIYTNDFISKRIKCVAQIPLFETHNSNDSGTPKASLSWTACEPYWEDLEETQIVLNNGVITNIENQGDVDIGVKINASGTFDEFMIVNQRTQKNINIKNILNGDVQINTLSGQKNAILTNDIIKFKTGGAWNGAVFRNWNEYYCGYGIYVKYYDSSVKMFQTSGLCLDITQNDSLIVACLNNKKIVVSTDGENWTESDTGLNDYFIRIEWSEGYFYGKFLNNSVYRSADLVTWETSTHTFTDKTKIYTGEYYYKIDNFGNALSLMKSADDSIWEVVKSFENFAYLYIYQHNKKIVVLGDYNTILFTENDFNTIHYDAGGVVSNYITRCKKIGSKYYCLGQKGGFFTEDFINLEQWLNYINNENNVDFVEKDGVYVIIGYNENYQLIISRSVDGINFKKSVYQNYQADGYARIHIFNNKYYIWEGMYLLESTDGENWTEYQLRDSRISVGRDFYITENNILFLISGVEGDSLYKCDDFLTESELTLISNINYEAQCIGRKDNTLVFAGNKLFLYNIVSGASKIKSITNIQVAQIRDIQNINGTLYFCGYRINGYTVDLESFVLYSEFAYIGFLTFVHNLDSTIFCGLGSDNVYTVGELDKQNTNIINYLKKDSDMLLQLKVGSNDMLILNNAESVNVLSYRQKYIGV